MADGYIYTRISNDYLDKTKLLKAHTRGELQDKIDNQLAIWSRQEALQRERDRILDLKHRTEEKNEELFKLIHQYKQILVLSLSVSTKHVWKDYYRKDQYPAFLFNEVAPELTEYLDKFNVPKKSIFEKLFHKLEEKRVTGEKKANQAFSEAVSDFDKRKDIALNMWTQTKNKHDEEVAKHNAGIDELRVSYENGKHAGVEYLSLRAIERMFFPENCISNFEVHFDEESQVLVVKVSLPNTTEIPTTREFKYVATTKSIKTVKMSDKEFNAFYDNTIKQIALAIIQHVIKSDYAQKILSVVFNGRVTSINKAKGYEVETCILSIQAARKDIANINFVQIDANECVRSLKGIYSGNLAQLAPVNPILEFDQNDSRFIQAKDILDSLDASENLATMDWESFEHLVRELFSKYFSDNGANVQVTQSSRDGGVDAIAFDPDPIRGGKFVIQAKRYNRVVPVSATRDLYGTMLNEGASRGILVTTSYYGNDSVNLQRINP